MHMRQNLRSRLVAKASRMNRTASIWGLEPAKFWSGVRLRRQVASEYRAFVNQVVGSSFGADFPVGRSYRIYRDREMEAGTGSGHYFHQDLLVARKVYADRPQRHIDVGSSMYGFVSHVASFREIDVLDVRPLKSRIPGVTFHQADVMNLDAGWDEYADSVSCLHALEHFGLGRYGDPIDVDGWHKGLVGLQRLCKQGGKVYLSVPTSSWQRVEFNAHRVFGLPYIRRHLVQYFQIESLGFVSDSGDLETDVDPFSERADMSFHARYGLSIWELRKA